MKIDILTLFSDMFRGFLDNSIIKRAIDKGLIEVNIVDFREYSIDSHHKVDDTPYGGGRGMVLACQPIFDAVEALKTEDSLVILLTPDGTVYKQKMAYDLSRKKHLIIISGHYEGFDERIRTLADLEISIGDYVLTGGEIPSMVIADSIIRLIDGVINEESHLNDSFNDDLLDYPVYTKPRVFRGMEVPEILLSGDHEKIKKYRQMMRELKTKERRRDILSSEVKEDE